MIWYNKNELEGRHEWLEGGHRYWFLVTDVMFVHSVILAETNSK